MHELSHPSYIIRPAAAVDVVLISDLVARVWADPLTDMKLLAGETNLTAKDLAVFVDDPFNVTLVNLSGTSLTGVVFLTRVAPTVFDLGLIAQPQGHGIGTGLLNAAIVLATADGLTTEIYLDVFARNPAVHLYERKNFELYERSMVTNQRGEELELHRMRLLVRKYKASRLSSKRFLPSFMQNIPTAISKWFNSRYQ